MHFMDSDLSVVQYILIYLLLNGHVAGLRERRPNSRESSHKLVTTQSHSSHLTGLLPIFREFHINDTNIMGTDILTVISIK
jgi:hypothetical protein